MKRPEPLDATLTLRLLLRRGCSQRQGYWRNSRLMLSDLENSDSESFENRRNAFYRGPPLPAAGRSRSESQVPATGSLRHLGEHSLGPQPSAC
jgi:hypothetical protein